MQFELADQLRARTVTIPTGEERKVLHAQLHMVGVRPGPGGGVSKLVEWRPSS
jgi:hypothetical protein